MTMESTKIVALHWFRKGLRLHDNPALLEACSARLPSTSAQSRELYPVFCIDPYFAKPDVVGVNRYAFLLESLRDLDTSLRARGSRLFVLKGKPEDVLLQAVEKWGVNLLTFETDTEPYAKLRDSKVTDLLQSRGVQVAPHSTHTLFDPEHYIAKCGVNKVPNTYVGFQKLFSSMGEVRTELEAPSFDVVPSVAAALLADTQYDVPTLVEMGYTASNSKHNSVIPTTPFPGGETEALRRLQIYVSSRPAWVRSFAKPDTSPNSLEPSTTVLSPYLKFGCLSAAKFFHEVRRINEGSQGKHSEPPVSLHGQLLWREFFYLQSVVTKNFDRMEGNSQCRQIPWERNGDVVEKWKLAQTGFPFIDAIMTQLRETGWIHHLARHMVACFLTRGDLWQHWEEGVKVFDLYLLDSDWALNNANWQWLSCSNFFYQYFRCYSPVAFGKKTDKEGHYIRKWIPKLAKYPDKYIYEPWKAPLHVQQQAGCIIGTDYPLPMVVHETASQDNMNKMKLAYAQHAAGSNGAVQTSEDTKKRPADDGDASGSEVRTSSKRSKK